MKKIILAFLMSFFVMATISAKTLVVYFSVTGNTQKLAKETAAAIGADIQEIIPQKMYTKADLNWRNKESRATVECNDKNARPEIQKNVDISSYDTVILCYPIWWAYAPKVVYTFVESQNWNGKKLVTLCTSGSSGLGQSGNELSKLAPGVDYKGGKDFTRKRGKVVKEYLDELLK
ncbi:MAG: NAD(P)H-dependent oxidoreductase [Treponema sp.]|nr:NAD(P)H-dependent oxidoreductase [Treponema sp.]